MARYVLARQLSNRKVITNEGEDLGNFVDININETTGKIDSIVVEPNPDSRLAETLEKDDGHLTISYDAVIAIGDYVIVDKRHL